MIAVVKSLLHAPTRTSEFALIAAFCLAGLVLSIALARYGMDFSTLM